MRSEQEFVTHLLMPRSAVIAASILEALQENDFDQLNRRLSKGHSPDFEPTENAVEGERRELLDALAARIGPSIASGQDAGLYIHLLRHLAGSASTAWNRETAS